MTGIIHRDCNHLYPGWRFPLIFAPEIDEADCENKKLGTLAV